MSKPPKPQPMTHAEALRFLATYLRQRPLMPAADKAAFVWIDKLLRDAELQTRKGTAK